MISRRGPNTFLIYGISAAVIALWWGGLWALGMDGESGGIVLLSVVAALVLAVAMMRDPFGMLCLIIFALPFSQGVLQVEIGIVTMNPYTAGITIACLVAVCGIGLGVVHYRYAPEDVLILLLGASYLLSTLLAEDVLEAGFLAFHGVFIPIVTYFALKSFVRTQEQYRKVLVSFVAGATTFAVYGLFNFVQNPERLHVLNMPPISAAAVMTAALIIVLYSEWWRRKIGLLAAVALLAGLVATFSRGYLLLLLLTPVFFAILRRGHATKLMVAMLVGSLVGTLLFVTSYEVFFVKLMNKEQEQSLARITDLQFWMLSLYNRARYYAVGLEEFAKSPLIGNGFHQNFASAEGRAVVWHNFHVEWLEYGGISAYLLYMSLLIVHFRSMSRASHAFRAAAVNLTVVFTILVNGLTNSFTAGVSPVLGFVFMALNRAYLSSVSWNRLAR
jgi:hypothetical protein